MTIEQALREVMTAWGVSNERKLYAIRLLLIGVDREKVVRLVQEMENEEGAARAKQLCLEDVNKAFDDFCIKNGVKIVT